MGKLAKLLLLAIAGLMTCTVAVYSYFGVVGLLVMFTIAIVGTYFAKKILLHSLKKLFIAPFKIKGAVLHNAAVTVHSVRPTTAPETQDEIEAVSEVSTPLNWYHIDATINPISKQDSATECGSCCQFAAWEPGEIRLLKKGVTSSDIMEADGGDDNSCVIQSYRIWDGTAFIEDEIYKFEGAQRLELLVGLAPGASDFVFNYYFEIFGEVTLPNPTGPAESPYQKTVTDNGVLGVYH